MVGDRWVVVLVRAWCEGDQFKARLICSDRDGKTEVGTVGSPAEASRQLSNWLERLPSQGPRTSPPDER